jgi:CHAP domain-containing protein
MRLAPLALLLPLAACATAPEQPAVVTPVAPPAPQIAVPDNPPPQDCVPYARQVSGIKLYGDAWTWWDGALASHYQRGEQPQLGAVLVLRKTRSLFHGHVAVVTNLVGPREVLVTHANWGNGWAIPCVVYSGMRVVDVSPLNDWTAVRFWNAKASAFGRVYTAYGFVYRQAAA